MDIALIYGVAFRTVYQILWEFVDAINATPSVGPFTFPQTEVDCKIAADKWQVCVAVIYRIIASKPIPV